jgi:hypothetical protein
MWEEYNASVGKKLKIFNASTKMTFEYIDKIYHKIIPNIENYLNANIFKHLIFPTSYSS